MAGLFRTWAGAAGDAGGGRARGGAVRAAAGAFRGGERVFRRGRLAGVAEPRPRPRGGGGPFPRVPRAAPCRAAPAGRAGRALDARRRVRRRHGRARTARDARIPRRAPGRGRVGGPDAGVPQGRPPRGGGGAAGGVGRVVAGAPFRGPARQGRLPARGIHRHGGVAGGPMRVDVLQLPDCLDLQSGLGGNRPLRPLLLPRHRRTAGRAGPGPGAGQPSRHVGHPWHADRLHRRAWMAAGGRIPRLPRLPPDGVERKA